MLSKKMIIEEPISNEEAAELIRSKDVVTREVYASMAPELKARAFVITGIEDMDLVQAIRDEMATVAEGADWFQTRDNIAAGLLQEWADPDTALRRATLLLRQHVFQAQSATRWRDMKATAAAFPYWQYVAFGDSRVRPSHQALDGLILPEDDPFWQDHYPPWDWGCRCMVRSISPEEYFEELEKDAERDPANRKVLTPEEAERMRETGQLVRGGQTVDVRSPRKRREDAGEDPDTAFGWSPGDMGIPMENIEDRWDDDVRDAFWASADAEPYEGGGSVGDWLRGSDT
jgi:SPP1 gp7 family putative phage head morphogenesis protein